MARKVTPQEFLDKVAFIKHLPEEGGSWGRGITMTLDDQAKAIRRLENARTGLDVQIKDRLSLMRKMARRVEGEATLVGYTKEQVQEAQVEIEVEQQEAEKSSESEPTTEE